MNYFKLIVALLASASLAAAAANHSGDVPSVRTLDPGHVRRMLAIVEEDDAAGLARELADTPRMLYQSGIVHVINKIIRLQRNQLFHFLFPRISFAFYRNSTMRDLLRLALSHNNLEVAEFLAGLPGLKLEVEPFEVSFWNYNNSSAAWDLEEMKAFFLRHREHAAAMAPQPIEMQRVANAAEAEAIIELARHCHRVSGRDAFDPSAFLETLVTPPFFADYSWKDDEQMGGVIFSLVQQGAVLDPDSPLPAKRPQAYQAFLEWPIEMIKEPAT